jgi:hypothetical protein
MSFKMRKIAAYALDGADWLLTAIAAGCVWLADHAEDSAVKLRR